ncbi:MAG: hypothetical protein C5B55_09785 [Blastocatellia bacterium]|nr:MAG: hypothetical protein C5B55_09785 [Blastocatellia bacterium]
MLHNAGHFVTGQEKVVTSGGGSSRLSYLMREVINKINSKVLGAESPYAVLLPVDYSESQVEYPVLYLMHGLFGQYDNWLKLTKIEELSRDSRLIIVMPEGRDGWYCDSETVPVDKYETFLTEELLPSIETTYRTVRDKKGRAIAGLSMGGYGAFKYALKKPHLFAFAASFSGAFDAAERTDESPGFNWDELRPSILRAFGEDQSPTRVQNDLFKLFTATRASEIKKLPYFYFDCGCNDGFMEANVRLKQILEEKGIDHYFAAIEGGHDWDYWGSRLPKLLALATERLIGTVQPSS